VISLSRGKNPAGRSHAASPYLRMSSVKNRVLLASSSTTRIVPKATTLR